VAKDGNSVKASPPMPTGIKTCPKAALHQYFLDSLTNSIGSAVHSELVTRQLEACLTGLRSFEHEVSAIKGDELASRYQQIFDEAIDNANSLLEDHILMFFVACQLYVTRVVEAVRWFQSLEGGHGSLNDIYNDFSKVRRIGHPLVGEMTIADCVWHLGNYAKHKDESKNFSSITLAGLTDLTVCETNGTIKVDAIWQGIYSMTGLRCDSTEKIKAGLESITELLKTWADELEHKIIAEIDLFIYNDSEHTKKLIDSFKTLSKFAHR